MSRRVNAKAASMLLTAAMVGSTVPVSVSAAAVEPTQAVETTVDTVDESDIQILDTSETGKTVIFNDLEPVTLDETMDISSLLEELLSMADISLPDGVSKEQIRLDLVDSEGYRTRVRVGDPDTDAAMSIQTLADLSDLAEEKGELSLVVFQDGADELLRMTFSVNTDGQIVIDTQTSEGTYLVQFYGNGGTLKKNVTVVRGPGEKLSYIEDTAEWDDVHTFSGWFTAEEGGDPVTEDTVVNGNLNVYAHWDSKTVVLSFDTQGGNPIEAQNVILNESVDTLPTPVREGYEFVGWFDAASGGNQITKIDSMSGDMTLYAQWKELEDPNQTFTLTFDTQGGNVIEAQQVKKGDSVNILPVPVREGYKFLGWFDAQESGTQVTKINTMTGDMTLYARWEEAPAETFTLTFNTQGGNTIEPQEVKKGESVDTLPTPVREGYEFVGWFDAASGGNQVTKIDSMSGNVTLYAQWKESEDPNQTFTLTFDTQGGNAIEAQQVKKGDSVNNLPTAVRDGYKFLGWFDAQEGGSKVTKINAMTGDMTLYARWEEVPAETFILTFDTQGGNTIEPQEVKKGESVDTLPTPVREGYKFIGWFDEPQGASQITKIESMTGNMTLYAQWQEAEDPNQTFTLSFNTQGGNSIESQQVKKGDSVNMLPTPVRDGYKFLGWFDAPKGGTQVTKINAMTDNLTLYAQWQKVDDSNQTFTLTFDTQGGNSIGSQKVKKGESVNVLPTPTKDGYKFLGWFDAASGGNQVTKIKSMSADMTLYAHWQKVDDSNGNNQNNNNNNNNNNDQQQDQQVQRYSLTIISPTGSKTEVGVNSDVTLKALSEKLGYTVSSWGIRTANTNETAVDENVTMKDIADVAEGSEVLLIAYDKDGNAMGSAKVTKTADGAYQVSLSKDTNVALSTMDGKGQGDDNQNSNQNGNGSGTDTSTLSGGGTGDGVANTGKGDTVAKSVNTADSVALPLYGGLSALFTAALGVLAFVKKKFLK